MYIISREHAIQPQRRFISFGQTEKSVKHISLFFFNLEKIVGKTDKKITEMIKKNDKKTPQLSILSL